MLNKTLSLLGLVAMISPMISPAISSAVPLSLENSGFAGGAQLGAGTIDPLFQLTANPAGTGAAVFVADPSKFPIAAGPWIADGPNSFWLSPQADPSVALAGGTYIYTTSLTIPASLDPNTVRIVGQVSADDLLADVRVNGQGIGRVDSAHGYGGLTPFALTSHFHNGANAIDFVVVNNPGTTPSGLRLQWSGVASNFGAPPPPAVPEPASLTLLGSALAALSLLRRRSVA